MFASSFRKTLPPLALPFTPMPIEYCADRSITIAQFVDILTRSQLSVRRPVDDPARLGAMLAQATLRSVPILYGMTVMLIIAAAIEGFWSPSGAPAEVKWAFSAVSSAFVLAYLGLAGRGTAREQP